MWHTTWQTMGNHIKITEIHSNEKKNPGILFNSLKNDVVVFMYKYLYSLQRTYYVGKYYVKTWSHAV